MKDYKRHLFTNVYSLVKGITVDGTAISVGTKIDQNKKIFARYYISNDEDIGSMDGEVRQIEISFDCVVRQPKHLGDDSKVDDLVDQIKDRTLHKNSYSLDGWNVVGVFDNGIQTDEDETESEFYNLVIFKLGIIIEKL
jgi:hypothetical protein